MRRVTLFTVALVLPGARFFLSRLPLSHDSIIIERDSTFATLLTESPNWQQVYADELAVVFVRK